MRSKSRCSAPQAKGACTVRRFWKRQPDEHGALIHRRNGSWASSYAPGDDDDEPIFRFDRHLFIEGEHVTVTEHDGVARPFKVVRVAPGVVANDAPPGTPRPAGAGACGRLKPGRSPG